MAKRIKIICVVAGGMILLTLAACFLAGNYFYNLALNPSSDKSDVFDAPHNQVEIHVSEEPESAGEWLERVGYEEVSLYSHDGLLLRGYIIRNETPTGRWVIACHGYQSRGTHMAWAARAFYRMGYNVLLPDARGHGQSEGSYIGMGWHDRLDVVRWAQMLGEDEETRVALYGVSMGAATVMMAAGEELPPNVRVIVEDCGYSSVVEEFTYQLEALFGLPRFPLIQSCSVVARLRAGYWLEEGNAVEQVKKAKVPMLFIHGGSDTFVPSYMLDLVYEAANVPKERILVEGAGHGAASAVMGEAYWQRVKEFMEGYI